MRSESLIRHSLLVAAIVSMAACSAPQTQKPQRPNGRPGGPGVRPEGQRPGPNGGKPKPPVPRAALTPDEALRQADANKDGAISLQEQMSLSQREADARFARMDRDNDGRLTSKELAEAEKRRENMQTEGKQGPPPQGPQSLLTRADSNHDGAVDLAENGALARQQASKRFHFTDKNRDGRLDRAELQARPAAGSNGN